MSYHIHQNIVTYRGEGKGHVGYAFEQYAREEYHIDKTTGHEDDGWCPEDEKGVEMKVARVEMNNDNPGRFILRKHQHRAAIEEDRDYILGIYRQVGAGRWVIESDIRVPSRGLHEVCGIENRSWVLRKTDTGYYREMGVRWTDLPVLGWRLPDYQRNPFDDEGGLEMFRGWD